MNGGVKLNIPICAPLAKRFASIGFNGLSYAFNQTMRQCVFINNMDEWQ